MEAEIVNAVVSSPHILSLLTEAFIPLVSILILVGLYRLAHNFVPQLISVINETKEQTRLMREMLNLMRNDIDTLKDDVDDVKGFIIDNNKRLNDIEKRIKD